MTLYRQCRAIVKRSLDIVVSFMALVLLCPLWAGIAIAIRLDTPGPVLFKQTRVSRHFKRFTCYKFRTMTVDTKRDACADPEIRKGITRVGHFLRKYKLDELPQLFNVLVGHMSLVGPRPMIARYVDMFPDHYTKILNIKPGLTGLASIKMYAKEEEMLSGGEDVYISKILPLKFRLNRFYLERMSTRFDMLIIYWTAAHLIKLCKLNLRQRKQQKQPELEVEE